MKSILFIALFLLLMSCSNKGDIAVSSSDSLVIQYKSIPSGEVLKTVTTAEPNAIKKLAQFVEEGKSEEFKCGTQGSLIFFNKGTVKREVLFAFSKSGCQHFIWNDEHQVMHDVKMSNEAAAFLKGLAEGTNPY